MSNNILCAKCGEIIHAEPSDVIHQLVEDIVVPVVDPLMVDIECAIAETPICMPMQKRNLKR